MPEIQVGIIMGSESDLPIMQKCADALDEFEIGWEVVISSTHRHPEKPPVMPVALRRRV